MPAAKPEPKTAEVKSSPMVKPETKTAEVKPSPVVKLEIKTAEAKPGAPAPEPKVLPPAPSKAASVKPVNAKAETKSDGKNAIPGLRLSANAF